MSNKKHWLDNPKAPNRITNILIVICSLLVLSDLLVHRHTSFSIENIPAFYSIFSFLASVCVVKLGELLRKLVKRDEDYYDG